MYAEVFNIIKIHINMWGSFSQSGKNLVTGLGREVRSLFTIKISKYNTEKATKTQVNDTHGILYSFARKYAWKYYLRRGNSGSTH